MGARGRAALAVVGQAFATRDQRGFQVGCATSAIGLWGFTVALAIAAYQDAGATAVGFAVVIRTLPAAVFAPIASWLGDRGSRQATILWSALASSSAYAGLGALSGAHGSLPLLFLLSALASVIATTSRLAQPALLPSLVSGPQQLASSTGVWNALDSAGFLAGSLLVGLAVSVANVQVAFLLLSGTNALAALAFATITPDQAPEHRAPPPDADIARELLLGAREVAASPELAETTILTFAVSLVDGMVDVLIVVVALRLLHAGEGAVGWLNSLWGLGGVVGGFVGLTLLGRGRFGGAISVGAVILGVPLAILAGLDNEPVAYIAIAMYGAGYGFVEGATRTLVQRLATDEALSRVFGIVEAVAQFGIAAGSMLAPVLVSVILTRGGLVVTAALLPTLVLARIGRIRSFDTTVAVPPRELALLRGLDIFAPLPLATVETLAVHARTARARAGGAIIHAGEIGRSFFAILEGEVDVVRPDGARFALGEGDYFGEIALLFDAPRNADVTALTDCTLVELESSAFLFAVTGHTRSDQTVRDVAMVRLGA